MVFLIAIFASFLSVFSTESWGIDLKTIEKLTKEKKVDVKDIETTIEVLKNKKKRDQFIQTLQGIRAAHEISKPQQTSGVTDTFDTFSDQIIDLVVRLRKLGEDSISAIESINDWDLLRKTLVLGIGILVFVILSFALEWGLIKTKKPILLKFEKSHLSSSMDRVWSISSALFSTTISAGVVILIAQQITEIQKSLYIFLQTFIAIRLILIIIRQLIFRDFSQFFEDESVLEAQKSFYNRICFLAWSIGLLVSLAIIFSALGLAPQSYLFLVSIIQCLTLFLIVITIWEMRYSKGLKLVVLEEITDKIPEFLYPLIRLLSKNYHFLITSLVGILLYKGVQPFTAIQNPLQTLFLGMLLVITWSAGRHVLHMLSEFLLKQSKNKSVVVASLAQSHTMVMTILRVLWHIFAIGVFLNLIAIDVFEKLSDTSTQLYIRRFLSVILILIVLRSFWVAVNYIIEQRMKPRAVGKRVIEPTQFVKTMAPIFRSLIHWALVVLAVIFTLEEFGMPILPIFYGVGFLGIAVSLGAQSLVKDFINGFFTLMEGNIAVGESVIIGSNTGTVETLSLRGVVLRHSNGALQTIPFSEVSSIINRSRDYMVVTIELAVSLKAEIQKVDTVLQETYKEMISDENFGSMIVLPLVIAGIDRITDHAAYVIATIRIKPDPSNQFLRAFNRRLKKHLQNENILPEPPVVTLLQNEIKGS